MSPDKTIEDQITPQLLSQKKNAPQLSLRKVFIFKMKVSDMLDKYLFS
jgi:hypothetical protein